MKDREDREAKPIIVFLDSGDTIITKTQKNATSTILLFAQKDSRSGSHG
jgi:hypothetical protein